MRHVWNRGGAGSGGDGAPAERHSCTAQIHSVLERADERVRVARQLGPLVAVRAAARYAHSTRRQVGLVRDVAEMAEPPIPACGTLEVTDARSFTAFSELAAVTPRARLLELRWYERFAATGAATFLVARDDDGAPAFSTWMLDAAGQAAHADRFVRGFHPLGCDEMLLEGVFVFPWARGRGVATAGIGAACAWAGRQGAARVWAYPYLDNRPILPALARSGFEARHARVERSSFGRARGRRSGLSPVDAAIWAAAGGAQAAAALVSR